MVTIACWVKANGGGGKEELYELAKDRGFSMSWLRISFAMGMNRKKRKLSI